MDGKDSFFIYTWMWSISGYHSTSHLIVPVIYLLTFEVGDAQTKTCQLVLILKDNKEQVTKTRENERGKRQATCLNVSCHMSEDICQWIHVSGYISEDICQ